MGKRYFTFQQLLLTLVNLFTFSCCYYIVHLIYVYNTERDTVIEDMIYRKKEGAALGDVFRRAKRPPKITVQARPSIMTAGTTQITPRSTCFYD